MSGRSMVADLAESVRSGRTKATHVVEEYLAAIERREGDIHAFNYVMADEARIQAAEVDAKVAAGDDPGPLAGVPVALKDNMCTRGIPTTCSSKILEGWKPPYDATVVVNLRDAGAVAIGKTNLDEFAMGSSTEHSAFGLTSNPLDLTRVPGGSSGGSAAAVAADFAPVSLGSDTGGSIRQPAAFCGLVGIKPTYGRVSRYGLVAFASSLDQIGPFGNSAEDAALVLQVIGGHDPLDSTSFHQPFPDLVGALTMGVEGMRVGIITEMMEERISADIRAQVQRAASVLEANGAEVKEVSVPAARFGLSAYYLIAPAEASSNLARYDGIRYGLRVEGNDTFDMYAKTREAGFGTEVKGRIMLGTYALSAGYYDAYYGKAERVRTLIIRDFQSAYETCDVLLSPSTPTTAFKFGERSGDPLSMYINDVCTIPSNLAGHPAMSVPFGADALGLPIGVQILGPALGEHAMLRAAGVIEATS